MKDGNEIWHVAGAIIVALIIAYVANIAAGWSVEHRLIFDALFFWSIFSTVLSLSICVLLHCGKVGLTRKTQAFFAASLVMLSVLVYMGFEAVTENAAYTQELRLTSKSNLFMWLHFFSSFGKSLIAFGVASFAVNILATHVPRRRA